MKAEIEDIFYPTLKDIETALKVLENSVFDYVPTLKEMRLVAPIAKQEIVNYKKEVISEIINELDEK